MLYSKSIENVCFIMSVMYPIVENLKIIWTRHLSVSKTMYVPACLQCIGNVPNRIDLKKLNSLPRVFNTC